MVGPLAFVSGCEVNPTVGRNFMQGSKGHCVRFLEEPQLWALQREIPAGVGNRRSEKPVVLRMIQDRLLFKVLNMLKFGGSELQD